MFIRNLFLGLLISDHPRFTDYPRVSRIWPLSRGLTDRGLNLTDSSHHKIHGSFIFLLKLKPKYQILAISIFLKHFSALLFFPVSKHKYSTRAITTTPHIMIHVSTYVFNQKNIYHMSISPILGVAPAGSAIFGVSIALIK